MSRSTGPQDNGPCHSSMVSTIFLFFICLHQMMQQHPLKHNHSQIFHGNIWDCAKLWGCPKNALPVLSSNHKGDGATAAEDHFVRLSRPRRAWYSKIQWTLARRHRKEKDDWKKYRLVCGEIFLAQINSALFEHRSPPERCCWPCPSIYEYSGGYFQQPCHRTLIISNWFSSTWQWVRCIPMASTVTRPHSGRETLENKAKWEISDNCLNVVAKSGRDVFLWRF